ncbi:helix-turn-helix domain-containing protein [Maribacter algicola]|uniref:Helix-turn-helix domain-containing protein n=1 Tax=Meishania litoralis TaxID=3434685 RepID=A0ACC7LGL2_9FLAO
MTAVFNFLMIAGAIQGLIFNVVTFLARKRIERPVLFLNLFVFFLSLNNLQSWFLEKKFFSPEVAWQEFTIPWYVLIVPMFYAFLIYYLEIEKKWLPLVKISIFIFLAQLLARSIVVYLVNAGIWSYGILEDYNIIEDIITFFYSIYLYFMSIQIVFGPAKLNTHILDYDDLKWIRLFLYMGGGVFILWVLAIILNITEWVQRPYNYYPLRLGSSILIYWVGYQAFFRYVVLKDRILLRKEIRKNNGSRNVDAMDESFDKRETVFMEVDRYIFENQKFVDPLLSLEGLSAELGMGVSSLSKLINTNTGGNFSDYINKYRVEQVKRLLADHRFSAYTIVAIGLECGFNSKSTFYTAFKKFTGKTPAAYRKEKVVE